MAFKSSQRDWILSRGMDSLKERGFSQGEWILSQKKDSLKEN